MDDHSPAQPTSPRDACGLPDPGEAGTPAEGRALPPAASPPPPTCTHCGLQPATHWDAKEAQCDDCARPVPPSPRPTSLDTSETSVGADPISAFLAEKPAAKIDLETILLNEKSLSSKFRHSGWWTIRTRIFEALKRTAQSSSRVASFSECGAGSWIEHCVEDPTRLRLKCNHCHDRLCTPCANQRSFRLSEALRSMIKDRPTTFITLTLCGKHEPLHELIDRLYRSFRYLRSHPIWEKVAGGAAFLEIKWSDKAQRWHPHLHIICEAKFIDQGELSKAWHSITKDSFIVDIRKVRDSDTTARYVTKYASKPLNMSFANTPKLLDEAILALKGRRLCLCFGTWYGTPLDLAEDETLADDEVDAGEWSTIATLEDVLKAANGGDAASIEMIRSINGIGKWLAHLTLV